MEDGDGVLKTWKGRGRCQRGVENVEKAMHHKFSRLCQTPCLKKSMLLQLRRSTNIHVSPPSLDFSHFFNSVIACCQRLI